LWEDAGEDVRQKNEAAEKGLNVLNLSVAKAKIYGILHFSKQRFPRARAQEEQRNSMVRSKKVRNFTRP
jgi:hypothetical protein